MSLWVYGEREQRSMLEEEVKSILCGEDVAEEDFFDVGGFEGGDALEGC